MSSQKEDSHAYLIEESPYCSSYFDSSQIEFNLLPIATSISNFFDTWDAVVCFFFCLYLDFGLASLASTSLMSSSQFVLMSSSIDFEADAAPDDEVDVVVESDDEDDDEVAVFDMSFSMSSNNPLVSSSVSHDEAWCSLYLRPRFGRTSLISPSSCRPLTTWRIDKDSYAVVLSSASKSDGRRVTSSHWWLVSNNNIQNKTKKKKSHSDDRRGNGIVLTLGPIYILWSALYNWVKPLCVHIGCGEDEMCWCDSGERWSGQLIVSDSKWRRVYYDY